MHKVLMKRKEINFVAILDKKKALYSFVHVFWISIHVF